MGASKKRNNFLIKDEKRKKEIIKSTPSTRDGKELYQSPEVEERLQAVYRIYPQLLKAHRMRTKRTCGADELVEAVLAAGGNLTLVANRYQVIRQTILTWLKNDHNEHILEEIDEAWTDIAETQLNNKILDGNLEAIKTRLKTKGKNRGYYEKQEHEINTTIKVKIEGEDNDW